MEMTSNYHAAKSFTLTQPLACGIVALKKFDHYQFMSKYDHTYDKFSFDSYHYLFQSNPLRLLNLINWGERSTHQGENLKLTQAKHMYKQCKSIYPPNRFEF